MLPTEEGVRRFLEQFKCSRDRLGQAGSCLVDLEAEACRLMDSWPSLHDGNSTKQGANETADLPDTLDNRSMTAI